MIHELSLRYLFLSWSEILKALGSQFVNKNL